MTWAFVVGWDRGVSPLGGQGELDFFVCRCALFAGVACATGALFLLGGSVLAGSHERLRAVALPLLCMALAVSPVSYTRLAFGILAIAWAAFNLRNKAWGKDAEAAVAEDVATE